MSKRARPNTRRADRPRASAKLLRNQRSADLIVWATVSKRTIVLFVLSLVVSSFALASANVETPEPPLSPRQEERQSQPQPVANEILPLPQVAFLSGVSPVLTLQNTQPSQRKPLVSQPALVSDQGSAGTKAKTPTISRATPLSSQVSSK